MNFTTAANNSREVLEELDIAVGDPELLQGKDVPILEKIKTDHVTPSSLPNELATTHSRTVGTSQQNNRTPQMIDGVQSTKTEEFSLKNN